MSKTNRFESPAAILPQAAPVHAGAIRFTHDARVDASQGFWLALTERRLVFPAIRGAAKAWIKRRVRHLAAEHLRMGGWR